MKKEVSDKQVILIVLIAIFISILSMLVSLTRLNITGALSSDRGYINVTIPSTVDISVGVNSIKFTAANPGQSRNSYNASEVQNCGADNHCGMNITNDGTAFINITIQETENLFTGGSYTADANFLYNVTMQDPGYGTDYGANGNCSVGYDQGLPGVGGAGYWRGVPRDSSEVAVCYLNNIDEGGACTVGHTGDSDVCPDTARIEINITVPDDEPTGSKTGTLTFTATAV